MFSPDRFGPRRTSFTNADECARPFIGLKTAFRNGPSQTKGSSVKCKRNAIQEAAHFRYSEPATPAVLKDRGLRPSDLSDPHKREFLTSLTTKVFHLALEGEEDHEKIPLERLFTPASDWEEIIPHKKKAYASSCFYRPDHPTIDDQVELAHKISTSLVDETNKTSKGQTMYIKRKNRSAKWIHQGEEGMFYEDSAASQYDMDDEAEEHQTKDKPPLKLVVNKNIAQDYSQIQHHYEDLLSTSQTLRQISNMEVGKEIATDLQSPTGKGAALFAKRKKRMDKFIIDETTVHQQPPQQSIVHEETKSSTTALTTTTVNNYQTSTFESKVSSQNQKQMNSLRLHNEPAVTAAPSVTKPDQIQTGGLMLPDLTDILTKPKPPEKKTPSLAERGISKKKPAPRSHSADSSKTTSGFQNKQFSQSQTAQKKEMLSKQTIHNGPTGQLYSASSFAGHKLESLEEQFTSQVSYQNPLESLRPGSPPTYMIPNGVESFVEHKIDDHATSQSINDISSSMATTNNGIEKIANEAVELATNIVTSGLHPLIANQAQAKVPSKLESFSSYSEPSKHDLKHAYNLSSALSVSKMPERGIKPERPYSLPIIPVANCSNPNLSCLHSASHDSIENTNISLLEKATVINSLADQCSVNMSFLEYQDLNNVKPVSLVSVLNETVDQKEVLITPVSVLSKNVDKPESPLIEPSWSDLPVFLDPVSFNTSNNQSMTELSTLSTCNNNSSTNDSCIISKGDFSPLRNISFNSFINFPKPFKSPTQDYSPVSITSQINISPSFKRTKEFDTVTSFKTFNSDKGAEKAPFKNNNISLLNIDGMDAIPNILEGISDEQFIEIQRSSSAVHKTDDLRQILEELDNMIELDVKLHNNFSDKVCGTEFENENIILNFDDGMPKFPDKPLTNEIEIKVQRTDSLVNEDELDDFITQIERSFSTTPTILEAISIQDLQPPEFYRSVSRTSINDDEGAHDTSISDLINEMGNTANENDGTGQNKPYYNDDIQISPDSEVFDPPIIYHKNNTQHHELNFVLNTDDHLLGTNALDDTTLYVPVVSDSFQSCNQSENSILTATQTEGSTRHPDINISPWSTESGAIYTAEVKVIQNLSPIPTSSIISYSAPAPQHSILSDLSSVQEKDKRKSFNLAPKGWGTYNTYYTPVHLGAP